MSPGHTLRFARDCLYEAAVGLNKHKLILIEYDELTKYPERTMKSLYKFIGEPYYNHDFTTVEGSYDEFDADVNTVGLHKIRKGVCFIERETILPPDIWTKYSNLEFWR
jgi:sulfotransferase